MRPFKINGEFRKWLKRVDETEIDELPKWLEASFKTDPGFTELAEGDGRNQTLFNYILKLQQIAMSKEEIRNTIRLINKHVLFEPISDKELILFYVMTLFKRIFLLMVNFNMIYSLNTLLMSITLLE